MMYNVASPSLASRTSPITPPHLVHFYAPTLPHLPCPCPSLQKTATCTHSAPPPQPQPLPASRQPQHAPRLCQQQRLRPGGAGVCMRASSLSTHATPHAMQHMHVLSCMCTHTHTHIILPRQSSSSQLGVILWSTAMSVTCHAWYT